ncbi:MAG TPA: chemotaxis-specific protein-glutamate methyltransferase CheB [Polyangiaceae bacterium]|nr:chemotaxis-specific protein-glutamate methyltransferase CheB [Polyangiaceae bacterium]
MKTKVRAVVVEDSLTVRKRIVEVLAHDPELEVVGEAEDGKQGIELCLRLRPNVIVLDMMLPLMSGLAVTEYIMAYSPTPILIVSASLNRGEVFRTYEALAAGAVDVLEKPTGAEEDDEWDQRLVSTVKLVSKIRVITHPRARLSSSAPQVAARPVRTPRGAGYGIVALGASTGGPGALVRVLNMLRPELPIPLVILLHIDTAFGASIADWLDQQTPHRVSFPRDGEPVLEAAGRVVIAPPARHLLVRDGRFRLTNDPERHSCRPSVDVLFESIAREFAGRAIAGVLTGMGRDGALGLLAIRQAGGFTFAQDEATSVVYGMPREAALVGAAEQILPLGDVGPTILELVSRKKGESP